MYIPGSAGCDNEIVECGFRHGKWPSDGYAVKRISDVSVRLERLPQSVRLNEELASFNAYAAHRDPFARQRCRSPEAWSSGHSALA